MLSPNRPTYVARESGEGDASLVVGVAAQAVPERENASAAANT
jgi:hypothetical protein